MAFDLKTRWPLQNPLPESWRALIKTFTHQKQLSDLVCFYIRQDASQDEAIMKIRKFETMLRSNRRYRTERYRQRKNTFHRGLIEHEKNQLIPPTHLVIARTRNHSDKMFITYSPIEIIQETFANQSQHSHTLKIRVIHGKKRIRRKSPSPFLWPWTEKHSY